MLKYIDLLGFVIAMFGCGMFLHDAWKFWAFRPIGIVVAVVGFTLILTSKAIRGDLDWAFWVLVAVTVWDLVFLALRYLARRAESDIE